MGYHIIRHAGLQEMCPSVTSQAEVKGMLLAVTVCHCPLPHLVLETLLTPQNDGMKTKMLKVRDFYNIHIATTNVVQSESLQEDIKLALIVKAAIDLNIHVNVMVNEDSPAVEEMEHVLKTFKYNKSAGTDQLKTEGLKYDSSNQLIYVLLLLFNLIRSLVSILMTQLKLHAIITCLHKKGLFNITNNCQSEST